MQKSLVVGLFGQEDEEKEMKRVGLFVAGFASGWIVRSTVDSSRGMAVGLIAATYGAVERAKRFVAIEREHLEDLWAEGKAQYETKRAREQARSGPRAVSADREGPQKQGRAA